MGVFAANGQARTFDFRGGDVGYVPFAMGHYVQNTGSTPLRFLEIFKSSYYADVSLNQWLALTPPELLKGPPQVGRGVHGRAQKDQGADRSGLNHPPKPGAASCTRAAAVRLSRPNKSKQNLAEPNKTKQNSLVLFVRIGTFQWVTANPNKKSFPLSGPSANRLKPAFAHSVSHPKPAS
jgi:Cupin